MVPVRWQVLLPSDYLEAGVPDMNFRIKHWSRMWSSKMRIKRNQYLKWKIAHTLCNAWQHEVCGRWQCRDPRVDFCFFSSGVQEHVPAMANSSKAGAVGIQICFQQTCRRPFSSNKLVWGKNGLHLFVQLVWHVVALARKILAWSFFRLAGFSLSLFCCSPARFACPGFYPTESYPFWKGPRPWVAIVSIVCICLFSVSLFGWLSPWLWLVSSCFQIGITRLPVCFSL